MTEHTHKKKTDPRVLAVSAFILLVIGGGSAALFYLAAQSKMVYIEKSTLQAPVVKLAATAPGVLKDVYVDRGQVVPPNTVVASVGTQLIKSTAGGLVITANDNIGKMVSPQDAVVEMIDPTALRVVGQVEEDKGLTYVKKGQTAVFTVDAFGSKKFTGVVDEVSPTSHAGDVVFNISDKRETQTFDVKVKFDTTAYPELKNGMSAKIWVYKQ